MAATVGVPGLAHADGAGPAADPDGKVERPIGALSTGLVGGILVLIAGVLEIDLGVACTYASNCVFTFNGTPQVYVVSGALGAVCGSFILVFAAIVYVRPDQKVLAGSMLLIFSGLSVLSFGGGFVIGLVLGIVAGILAFAWRPHSRYVGARPVYWSPPTAPGPGWPVAAPPAPLPSPPASPTVPPVAAPVAPPVPAMPTCGKCGRPLHADAKFCSQCGTPVGGS